jgi:hypothetical protein
MTKACRLFEQPQEAAACCSDWVCTSSAFLFWAHQQTVQHCTPRMGCAQPNTMLVCTASVVGFTVVVFSSAVCFKRSRLMPVRSGISAVDVCSGVDCCWQLFWDGLLFFSSPPCAHLHPRVLLWFSLCATATAHALLVGENSRMRRAGVIQCYGLPLCRSLGTFKPTHVTGAIVFRPCSAAGASEALMCPYRLMCCAVGPNCVMFRPAHCCL